ncbi:MAG: triose-phosphate isomerase [Gammaproteobacteria bacterium]|nr:triose-phosphate isomerase [Gammaproteobacteria bacterium]
MRRSIVAANWKLNGSLEMAQSLVKAIDTHCDGLEGVDAVICPPFPYLSNVATHISANNVYLGAQSVAEHQNGAYTGEVSAEMVAEMSCRYAIVGHSERREYYGETDAIVAAKYLRIQAAGIVPILCVGESLQQREQGIMQDTIVRQVNAVVNEAGIANMENAVLAYEPIWAIGTGKTASPEQAQEVHAIIRSEIAKQSDDIAQGLRILYGGSVKANNAAELFSQPDIDGGLIGGASLDAGQFNAIVSAGSSK